MLELQSRSELPVKDSKDKSAREEDDNNDGREEEAAEDATSNVEEEDQDEDEDEDEDEDADAGASSSSTNPLDLKAKEREARFKALRARAVCHPLSISPLSPPLTPPPEKRRHLQPQRSLC